MYIYIYIYIYIYNLYFISFRVAAEQRSTIAKPKSAQVALWSTCERERGPVFHASTYLSYFLLKRIAEFHSIIYHNSAFTNISIVIYHLSK